MGLEGGGQAERQGVFSDTEVSERGWYPETWFAPCVQLGAK